MQLDSQQHAKCTHSLRACTFFLKVQALTLEVRPHFLREQAHSTAPVLALNTQTLYKVRTLILTLHSCALSFYVPTHLRSDCDTIATFVSTALLEISKNRQDFS